MAQTPTRTQITRAATVFVPVRDHDGAIEFYGEALGFEKRARGGPVAYRGGAAVASQPPMFRLRDPDVAVGTAERRP